MEGSGDTLRQKRGIIPVHLPDQGISDLDQIILTTLSSESLLDLEVIITNRQKL